MREERREQNNSTNIICELEYIGEYKETESTTLYNIQVQGYIQVCTLTLVKTTSYTTTTQKEII